MSRKITLVIASVLFAAVGYVRPQTSVTRFYLPVLQAERNGDIGIPFSNPTIEKATVELLVRGCG